MKRFRRRNKFSAAQSRYKAKPTGQFKSQLESRIWKQLPHKRKGLKLQYEKVRLDYVVKKTYIPDIVVDLPDGKRFFIEVKGFFRVEDRTKMIAAKAFNPDLDIRIVFASNSTLRKGSKTRYSDWCEKHGFQYAIGEVPSSWFEEENGERQVAASKPGQRQGSKDKVRSSQPGQDKRQAKIETLFG